MKRRIVTCRPAAAPLSETASLSCSPRAPMPTPTFDATCAEVNGLLHVIGGQTRFDTQVARVEAYDPATHTWTRKTDMTTPRAQLTSFVSDGRIFVAGGRHDLYDLTTLEVYTP